MCYSDIVVNGLPLGMGSERCGYGGKKPLKPRFLYNVDAAAWFDNREYENPYQIAQTLFAIRLSPEIGVGLTDKEGGEHRVMAGVHYIQPMGGDWPDVRFHPTAYYSV